MPPEELGGLYAAAPTALKAYKKVRAPSVPPSPVSGYKADAKVDLDEEGMISRERDVFLRTAVADHCIMVIMQFLERVRFWSSERLKDLLDFDTRMNESRRDVFLRYFSIQSKECGVWWSTKSYCGHSMLRHVHLRPFCVLVRSAGPAPKVIG